MAALEQNIYARIAPLCARVYPDVAPIGAALPYVTWQQVGGTSDTFADSTLPSKRNAEVQVNAWGATRQAVNVLMLSIESALATSPTSEFCATPRGAFVADYDHDNLIFSARQDFTIWNNR